MQGRVAGARRPGRATPTSGGDVEGNRWLKARAWATANVVAALTLSGLILYVILRLPYSIYYGRLGSTPEDIGLDYISLLSQSVLGVLSVALVIVFFLGLAFLVGIYGAFIAIYATSAAGMVETFRAIRRLGANARRPLRDLAFDPSVSKQDLDEILEATRELVRHFPESVQHLMFVKLEAARKLHAATVGGSAPDHDELAELTSVLSERTNLLTALLRDGVKRARRFTEVIALPVTLLVAIVGLPVTALFDAERVRDCHNSRVGAFGISGFHGTTATVWLVRDDGVARRELPNAKLMLLGRTSDTVVLYDCAEDLTIRVPSDSRIVKAE